jgi:lipid A disaccharide synthetase
VIPEIIKNDATPKAVAQAMTNILNNSTAQQMTNDFAVLRTMLSNGTHGTASHNAARIIAEMVG